MTYPWHYRIEDWIQPGYPMTGPRFDWSTVEYITIHYPGAPRTLPLSEASERAEIQAENREYLTNRNPPYSLGYNAKVFQDGTRWELRGDRYRCAANGSSATNLRGFAIQIRVANTEEPSPLLIDSVRELVAWARAQAGRHIPINGHRDLKPTGCPGEHAYRMIQAGVFEPVVVEVDPPVVTPAPIPPTSEEDDMPTPAIAAIYKPTAAVTIQNPKWFALCADGSIRHASGPDVAYANAVKAPTFPIEGLEHYNQLDAASKAR